MAAMGMEDAEKVGEVGRDRGSEEGEREVRMEEAKTVEVGKERVGGALGEEKGVVVKEAAIMEEDREEAAQEVVGKAAAAMVLVGVDQGGGGGWGGGGWGERWGGRGGRGTRGTRGRGERRGGGARGGRKEHTSCVCLCAGRCVARGAPSRRWPAQPGRAGRCWSLPAA